MFIVVRSRVTVTSFWFLSMLVTISCTSTPSSTPGFDPCRPYSDCASCLASSGCGWCDGLCMSGNASGPVYGTCSSRWTTPGSTCSPPVVTPPTDAGVFVDEQCRALRSCDTCLGMAGCGWCPTTRQCDGVFPPAVPAACSGGRWTDLAFCSNPPTMTNPTPTPDCSGAGSCQRCSVRTGCGWCGSSNSCVPGGSSGPDRGTCSQWHYGASTTCPVTCRANPGEACSTDSDCCRASTGLTYRCAPQSGGGNTCVPACITNANCGSGCCTTRADGLQYCALASVCTPPPPPCSARTNCVDCGANDGCGWCSASNTCMPGNGYGPTSGSCGGGWTPYATTCGHACRTISSCSSCAARSDCGWCASSRSCWPGTSSGPNMWSGACRDWQFVTSACR